MGCGGVGWTKDRRKTFVYVLTPIYDPYSSSTFIESIVMNKDPGNQDSSEIVVNLDREQKTVSHVVLSLSLRHASFFLCVLKCAKANDPVQLTMVSSINHSCSSSLWMASGDVQTNSPPNTTMLATLTMSCLLCLLSVPKKTLLRILVLQKPDLEGLSGTQNDNKTHNYNHDTLQALLSLSLSFSRYDCVCFAKAVPPLFLFFYSYIASHKIINYKKECSFSIGSQYENGLRAILCMYQRYKIKRAEGMRTWFASTSTLSKVYTQHFLLPN
jgi:hypothetical protein